MEIVQKKLDEIKPYEKNPRNNDSAVDYVANSIKEFGFKVTIVIDKDGIIVAGHTRYKASKKLGLKTVPCVVADDLTDEQIKAYRLADNKVSEQADWNIDLLTEELSDIIDIDMVDFGFDLSLEEEQGEAKDLKNNDFFYFDKDEIISDLEKEFKKYNTVEDYVKNIISIPKAKYQFNRLCQGYRDGYNISLLFNPHRLDTPTITSKSIYDAYNNDEKYKTALSKFMVNVQNKVPVENEFYKYIGIGSGGIQYVNEFQPYLARDIYKKYCKDGDKILNPCAGWGGRLIGLASCLFKDIEYVETDPSTKTYNGLIKLKDFLNLGDNYKQYNLPFEDLELKENYFDFVFTSPPYFDTEQYADEETQSYKKNANYEIWRDNFLYIMIDKIVYSLKKGGKCILNVGDKKYPISTDIKKYLDEKYKIKTKNDNFSLDSNENTEAIRSSEEKFILFEK
jgi:hypothetical protein